ncbi:ABC transporter permease [Compostibacter hankyongensis]
MFRSYLKTAWRNVVKNKLYASVNILGLAAGLAGFIIILLYLNYELSYDSWDPSLKRVYKIGEQRGNDILEQTPNPLAAFLKQTLPEVETATAMQPAGEFEVLLSAGDRKIFQQYGVGADSNFLKVFPYPLIAGDAATALKKPNAIIISTELATKLFGSYTDAIGKVIKIHNQLENEITGVFARPKSPSHFNAQFVYRSPYEKIDMQWSNASVQTYVKTFKPVDLTAFEEQVNSVYYNERLKKDKQSFEDYRKTGHLDGLFADAVKDIHNFPKHGKSNFPTVSILLLLAVLLLLAGAINFSNLSIASSMRRAKEIGVRKVLGSGRKQISVQVIAEIALQCLISLCLACIMVIIILPYFKSAFDISFDFVDSVSITSVLPQIIFCILVVILISGIYPAIFLSRYNTIKVLKGNYSTGRRGVLLRNALIVIQFIVAAFFITSTLVIKKQMHYMQTRDKGFSGEQVMRLQTVQQVREAGFEAARNELLSIPGVEYVSKTTNVPGDAFVDTTTMVFKHAGKEYRLSSVKVSDDYFKTLGIALVKGRLFNGSYADENTRSAIINESAMRKLGLNDPVGETITFPWCDSFPVQIVGVVNDFSLSGFEHHINPSVFTVNNKACVSQGGGAILLKLNSKNLAATIAAVEARWKNIDPDFPIRYTFLDDNFQKLFVSYKRLQLIINFFAITAILITLTGLFALTTYVVNNRVKEIGIRKVLGASIHEIHSLISKEFMQLVLLAVLIATPLGWVAADKWLQHFAYKTSLGWGIFLNAAIIVLLIALATMSIQIIKAAMANPVGALRSE